MWHGEIIETRNQTKHLCLALVFRTRKMRKKKTITTPCDKVANPRIFFNISTTYTSKYTNPNLVGSWHSRSIRNSMKRSQNSSSLRGGSLPSAGPSSPVADAASWFSLFSPPPFLPLPLPLAVPSEKREEKKEQLLDSIFRPSVRRGASFHRARVGYNTAVLIPL